MEYSLFNYLFHDNTLHPSAFAPLAPQNSETQVDGDSGAEATTSSQDQPDYFLIDLEQHIKGRIKAMAPPFGWIEREQRSSAPTADMYNRCQQHHFSAPVPARGQARGNSDDEEYSVRDDKRVRRKAPEKYPTSTVPGGVQQEIKKPKLGLGFNEDVDEEEFITTELLNRPRAGGPLAPDVPSTPERTALLKEVSEDRVKFWKALRAFYIAYPRHNFLSHDGDVRSNWPLLAYTPVDIFLLFQHVISLGGYDTISAVPENSADEVKKCLSETGELEIWTDAWEEVYDTLVNRFENRPKVLRENVDAVPFRRTKVRRIYRMALLAFEMKCSEQILRDACAVSDGEINNGSNSTETFEYVRCVCGHAHESPIRTVHFKKDHGKMGGAGSKVSPTDIQPHCTGCLGYNKHKYLVQCRVCGCLQHAECAKGLFKLAARGWGNTTGFIESGGSYPLHTCEMCLGVRNLPETTLFCAPYSVTSLLKYELPDHWTCEITPRGGAGVLFGGPGAETDRVDYFVLRGFPQVVEMGNGDHGLRSIPGLAHFEDPLVPGRLRDRYDIPLAANVLGGLNEFGKPRCRVMTGGRARGIVELRKQRFREAKARFMMAEVFPTEEPRDMEENDQEEKEVEQEEKVGEQEEEAYEIIEMDVEAQES